MYTGYLLCIFLDPVKPKIGQIPVVPTNKYAKLYKTVITIKTAVGKLNLFTRVLIAPKGASYKLNRIK